MYRKSILIGATLVLAMMYSCGGSQDKSAAADSASVQSRKFPEPTDSLAGGLHPYYPTEQNIIGKWALPDPTDTTPESTEGFIEFLADHSMKAQNHPYAKPVKWALSGNVLVITHESGDPVEQGRMLNDTLVLEAVSDTTIHYFNLHEPNFIMYLRRKK
jgi:hypothetical protein